jgi:hypothetical protein
MSANSVVEKPSVTRVNWSSLIFTKNDKSILGRLGKHYKKRINYPECDIEMIGFWSLA